MLAAVDNASLSGDALSVAALLAHFIFVRLADHVRAFVDDWLIFPLVASFLKFSPLELPLVAILAEPLSVVGLLVMSTYQLLLHVFSRFVLPLLLDLQILLVIISWLLVLVADLTIFSVRLISVVLHPFLFHLLVLVSHAGAGGCPGLTSCVRIRASLGLVGGERRGDGCRNLLTQCVAYLLIFDLVA